MEQKGGKNMTTDEKALEAAKAIQEYCSERPSCTGCKFAYNNNGAANCRLGGKYPHSWEVASISVSFKVSNIFKSALFWPVAYLCVGCWIISDGQPLTAIYLILCGILAQLAFGNAR